MRIDEAQARVASVQTLLADPSTAATAHRLMADVAPLAKKVAEYERLTAEAANHREMIQLAAEEGDESLLAQEAEAVDALLQQVRELEIRSWFQGDNDPKSCFLEVQAGAGGKDSNDWARMLLKMYTQWAEGRGFEVDEVERYENEDGGIRTACLHIKGDCAYGWLKVEMGVHRLVRISPYDAAKRRHTSFARILVLPEQPKSSMAVRVHRCHIVVMVVYRTDIELAPSDLSYDFFRASGPGGQHVNKTDSAVRVTHIPTGVSAACQKQRSQHQNKAEALQLLKAKLEHTASSKAAQETAQVHASQADNSWGNQIRSYVLAPYQLVKDHRTGFEVSTVQGILDGDLDDLMEAALAPHSLKP